MAVTLRVTVLLAVGAAILYIVWPTRFNDLFSVAASFLAPALSLHVGRAKGGSDATPLPFTRHIIAVGDLHGDLPNARRVLRFAGVVDKDGNWAAGHDFFVQTGDIIDRGDDTIALFQWMDRLRGQAAAAGGTVLTVLGNHEWMNVIGDWRYVYPSEIETFGDLRTRQRSVTRGALGGTWAANYTSAVRLPLHSALGPPNTPYPANTPHPPPPALAHAALSFVHGGLSPTYADLTPFPSNINTLAATLLRKLRYRVPMPLPHPPAPYAGLPTDTTNREAAFYSANGPLWYRGWAQEPEDRACAQVVRVLRETGTRRMIMGHTPDFHNIVSRCDGKILIIDTGISHAYGGALSALSIHYTLTSEGDGTAWREREVVSALYEERREVLVDEERVFGV